MTLPSRIDNMRVVRAARGTTLSAKSWLTEAPLRMLMNNLDPDVAERPGELVVYGGIGRAARDWRRSTASSRRCAGSKAIRRCSSSLASRSACSAPMPMRRVCSSPTRISCRIGRLGIVQRARSQGAHDVRPDDRGLVDLYRLAGHRAGHLRDLRRDGAQDFGGDLPGEMDSTAGLGGMGGAQPLAASMAGASLLAVNAARRASNSGCAPAMSTCKPRISTRRSRSSKSRRMKGRPSGRVARQCGRGPARTFAPRRQARHRD